MRGHPSNSVEVRKYLLISKRNKALCKIQKKKINKKNLLKIHHKKLQENILPYTHSRYTTPCSSETSKNNFKFIDFFPHFHNKSKMGTIDNFVFCWDFLYITSVFSFLRKLNIPPSKNIVKKIMKNRIIKRQATI